MVIIPNVLYHPVRPDLSPPPHTPPFSAVPLPVRAWDTRPAHGSISALMHSLKEGASSRAPLFSVRGHCFWQTIAPLLKAGGPGRRREHNGSMLLAQFNGQPAEPPCFTRWRERVQTSSDASHRHRCCRVKSEENGQLGNTCPPYGLLSHHTHFLPFSAPLTHTSQTSKTTIVFCWLLCFSGVIHCQGGSYLCVWTCGWGWCIFSMFAYLHQSLSKTIASYIQGPPILLLKKKHCIQWNV